jgi:transposase
MKFVATKTADQLDLQALHRVRERLVSQRTGITKQIRAFLLERRIAVRQGLRHLRTELPRILATRTDACGLEFCASSRAWRATGAIWTSASKGYRTRSKRSPSRQRLQTLMTVPGIGPIISSGMVAAIGTTDSGEFVGSAIVSMLRCSRFWAASIHDLSR